LPEKWVIVSDGSTDRTDEIVKRYTNGNDWIEFVRMPEHRDRNFAAKVHCFNKGYEIVKNSDFDIIGNLDADISFDENYFAFLLEKFSEDHQLGVAGTPFVERSSKTYNYNYASLEHVSGACQLFRRLCFEEIGGYIPNRAGGIDWIAVTSARMKGWKTRTFPEKTCFHHRPIGTGNSSGLGVSFRYGKKDYFMGFHPLWEFFRAIYKMKSRPIIWGGIFLLFGYMWAFITRVERPVTDELLRFYRAEQMDRLKKIFLKALKISG
jgi:glycosyltransferase involved in cell wall biosynthesis